MWRTPSIWQTTLAAAVAGGALACAGLPLPGGAAAQTEPPLAVDVRVGGLRNDEQESLKESLCGLSGVVGCEMRRDPKEVVYALQYHGSLHTLQHEIKRLPHPGLRPEEVKATLKFQGFDNKPPTLTVLSPKEGLVTSPDVEVVLDAPDKDVARVEVGGRSAQRQRPGIYAAKIKLAEGPNTIPVRAVDEAGNEATLSLALTLDTTPPDLTATVKVVVEGSVERGSAVFVEGQPVPVDMLGRWRVELAIRRGQRTVEIVAIDANGNKRVEQRAIGID
jgi:hypothetical protein